MIERGILPWIVMEPMQNGDLYSIIHNDVLPLDIELVASILSDAAKGLRYLHEAKPPVIHGDLKAMNILVDDRLTGKLADYGLSFLQGKANIEGGSRLWDGPGAAHRSVSPGCEPSRGERTARIRAGLLVAGGWGPVGHPGPRRPVSLAQIPPKAPQPPPPKRFAAVDAREEDPAPGAPTARSRARGPGDRARRRSSGARAGRWWGPRG